MLNTLNYEIHAYDCQTVDGITTYTANHGLGTKNILCTLIDPSGDIMNGSNMFTLTDNTVTVNIMSSAFNGSYKLSVYYEDGSNNYNKKKLFEQALVPYDKLNQYGDYRLAIGKEESMTQNVTLNDFKNGMAGQNLPYLSDDPTNWDFTLTEQLMAQYKLDVYNKGLVDNMYSSVYPVTGIINNITSFTRNTTSLSTDPVLTTVIHPSGVHITMVITATAGELTGSGVNIGYFKINPYSMYNVKVNNDLYTAGLIVDGNDILQGTCVVDLNAFVSSGSVTVPVLITTNNASYNKTITFSIDIPLQVTSINS